MSEKQVKESQSRAAPPLFAQAGVWASHFVNEQIKRDEELLKMLEERKKEMEKILLQKANAFGYLYKAHQKEIKDTIQMRDDEMEASLNYREKLWTESLDIYNSNLRNMYNAQGEFEGTLNSIRERQNELIKSNARMLEWATNKLLGDKTTKKPQVSIPKFVLSQDGYPFEQVNIIPSKSYHKKKK